MLLSTANSSLRDERQFFWSDGDLDVLFKCPFDVHIGSAGKLSHEWSSVKSGSFSHQRYNNCNTITATCCCGSDCMVQVTFVLYGASYHFLALSHSLESIIAMHAHWHA